MSNPVPPEGDWHPVVLACGHEVLDASQSHYCTYIAIDRLPPARPHLGCAIERDLKHDDEHWFIRVHHLSELAFDEVVFNLKRAVTTLTEGGADSIKEAQHILWRVVECVKVATAIVKPLRTMRQSDFFVFRASLKPASGLESIGARRIELLSGMRADSPYVTEREVEYTYRQFLDRPPGPGDNEPKTRLWTAELTELANQPSVVCLFKQVLARAGITLDDLHDLALMLRNKQPLPASYANREEEIKWLKLLCDRVYNLEVAWYEWRTIHIAVTRPQLKGHDGTGHTTGVAFLEAVAAEAKFYPELAQLRALRREDALPEGPWIST